MGLDDEQTSEAAVVQIDEQEWATVVLPSPTYLLDGRRLMVKVVAGSDGEVGVSLVVADEQGEAYQIEIELYRGGVADLARRVV